MALLCGAKDATHLIGEQTECRSLEAGSYIIQCPRCHNGYTINITGANLYNIKVAHIWKTVEQKCIIGLQKLFVLSIIAKMYTKIRFHYINTIEKKARIP